MLGALKPFPAPRGLRKTLRGEKLVLRDRVESSRKVDKPERTCPDICTMLQAELA